MMLKIKDEVDLKELERFYYMQWNKENGEVEYFKLIPENGLLIQINKDRTIDFQLPIQSLLKKEDIKLEKFIDDLIQAGIVETIHK